MRRLICGIYLIECVVNGKVYVGSSVNIAARWRCHKSYLNRNIHDNIHLQRAWNQHLEGKFLFKIIELVADKMKLIAREQFWIDSYNSANDKCGYNILPNAGNTIGYKPSKETRAKMSESHRGRKMSEEQKALISKANKGLKRSPEFCQLMRQINTGYKHSDSTRVNVSRATKGENNPRATISQDQADRVRALLQSGYLTKEVSKMTGVSETIVCGIKCGKQWGKEPINVYAKCPGCEKEFLRLGKMIYCTRECGGRHRGRTKNGRDHRIQNVAGGSYT